MNLVNYSKFIRFIVFSGKRLIRLEVSCNLATVSVLAAAGPSGRATCQLIRIRQAIAGAADRRWDGRARGRTVSTPWASRAGLRPGPGPNWDPVRTAPLNGTHWQAQLALQRRRARPRRQGLKVGTTCRDVWTVRVPAAESATAIGAGLRPEAMGQSCRCSARRLTGRLGTLPCRRPAEPESRTGGNLVVSSVTVTVRSTVGQRQPGPERPGRSVAGQCSQPKPEEQTS